MLMLMMLATLFADDGVYGVFLTMLKLIVTMMMMRMAMMASRLALLNDGWR